MGSPVDRATRRPRGPADSRDVLPGGGAALLGPAFVASIAYVDPGNVATNVAAGAAHGYLLVWVLVAANVLAMLVQYLSAKLGVATGATLPGLCREQYPRPVALGLWAQAELVAIATDLAEVLGGAIALHLLFGIPLLTGGVITGAVSFAVLALQSRRSQRTFEIVITGMLAVILVGFLYSALDAGPAMGGFAGGLVPRLAGVETLLLAAGMLGATVMPHAIYLHSALVRDRHRTDLLDDSQASLARRHRLLTATRVDVVAAMAVAGSVNIAMLLV
ncbi:MAG: Nramp family divalent metal transporter, partial [Streptomycetales bacterium]